MFSDGPGSVTQWVDQLRDGRPEAASPLWDRYFGRLVGVARRRLGREAASSAVADEEDAALSAFGSFCAAAAAGRFSRLDGRDDLWKLLVVITARKAAAQVAAQAAAKRGGRHHPLGHEAATDALAHAIGREPSPDFAAIVEEEQRRLLDLLGDDELRRVATARLDGDPDEAIAARLGCARRTVARRLALIRDLWSAAAIGR